ncbi:hypothetical protein G7Y79_00002g007170 [Physcia stellaris]|nr:hypothetical protein G7Y79_00002g007170 [Physcia stellaris]
MTYQLHNASPHQPALPTPLPKSFTILTPPDCDTWRKPPSTNRFNAPLLLRSLPLSSLRSARVTVNADWKTKFDQGGLVLVLPGQEDRGKRRWVKTGIEFFEGRPNISTVACDRWADWSLAPLPQGARGKITIELSREVEDGEKTTTLWVHSVDADTGERRALREVSWVFEDESLRQEVECEIGVYVAKPIRDEADEKKELEVNFEDLVIEQW